MTTMVLLLQVFQTLSSSGQELAKERKTARVIGGQVEIRARAIDGGIQLRSKLNKAIGIGQLAIPETEEADFRIFREDIPKFIKLIEDAEPSTISIGFNIMNRKITQIFKSIFSALDKICISNYQLVKSL